MSLDSSIQDRQREGRLVAARAAVAGVLVLIALGLVVVRLARLQVHDHQHFSVLSQDNRVKVQPVPPTRGLIYDAKGEVLADNHPSFSLEITIEKVESLDATIAALAAIIRVDEKDRERFERLKRQRVRFQGVPLRLNLTPEEVARFSLDSYRFPGVDVRAELIRTYPHGELTAHVPRLRRAHQRAGDGPHRYQRLRRDQLHRQGWGGEGPRGPAARTRRLSAGGGERPRAGVAHPGGQGPGPRVATCICSWTSPCRPRPRRPWGTIAGRWWPSTRATAGCWPW